LRILIVEDDRLLGEGLQAGLRQDRHAVDWVTGCRAAESALATESFDLVILDLGLPDGDGLVLLRRLRGGGATFPVLVLTARDTIEARVRGLDGGADDYLVKPFDLDELRARARALARRNRGQAQPLIELGNLQLDPATHAATLAGRALALAPREFAVLEILLENAGRVVTRRRLEERVYGWDDAVGSNTVEVHVHHLRRKLGSAWIRTVRGVGYVIDVPG
jgi:DNA-binding response OmpR family regulator